MSYLIWILFLISVVSVIYVYEIVTFISEWYYYGKPILCFFGLHKWENRVKYRTVKTSTKKDNRPLPLAMPPFPIRFIQCRKCDKTDFGWIPEKPKKPEPMPWG